mmetsp:Transcript_1167/g.1901  ORF Transcript_1167/g.1901 Transcript_1167/m.1901 type:complete len:209 (-) Transcript_1167:98-724(-)
MYHHTDYGVIKKGSQRFRRRLPTGNLNGPQQNHATKRGGGKGLNEIAWHSQGSNGKQEENWGHKHSFGNDITGSRTHSVLVLNEDGLELRVKLVDSHDSEIRRHADIPSANPQLVHCLVLRVLSSSNVHDSKDAIDHQKANEASKIKNRISYHQQGVTAKHDLDLIEYIARQLLVQFGIFAGIPHRNGLGFNFCLLPLLKHGLDFLTG